MPQVVVSDNSGTTVVMNGDTTGDHRGTKEDHSVNTDRAVSAENRLLGPPSLSSSRCVQIIINNQILSVLQFTFFLLWMCASSLSCSMYVC